MEQSSEANTSHSNTWETLLIKDESPNTHIKGMGFEGSNMVSMDTAKV